jgi:hypothetical protein
MTRRCGRSFAHPPGVSKRVQVTFDAADPHGLAAWWAELLGYVVEDGHDFIAGLVDAGTVSESDVVLVSGRLFFADAVAANDSEGLGADGTR